MMKPIFLLLMVVCFYTCCLGQPSGFVIRGQISDSSFKASRVLLQYRDSSGQPKKDTAMVHGDRFLFRGQFALASRIIILVQPDTMNAIMKGKRPIEIRFAMENASVVLDIKGAKNWNLSGSLCHLDEKKYRSVYLPAIHTLKGDALAERQRFIIDSFIRAEPSSFFSLILLEEKARTSRVLGELSILYQRMPSEFKDGLIGRNISERIAKLEAVAIGQTAPDFALNDLDGQLVRLSAYRGRYVLLHFWASWCIPCRQENQYLLKAHQQLAGDSLVLIGVSVDDDKYDLLKAIHRDQLSWLQLASFTGFDQQIVRDYGAKSVPRNFLIDPTGKIVGMDFRGAHLLDQIKAIIQ